MADTKTGAASSEAGKTAEPTGQSTTGTSSSDAGKTTEQTGTSKTAAGEAGKEEKTGEQQKTGTQGTSSEKGGKAGEEPPQPKAPDKYELKTPDALKGYADPSTLAEVEAFARANNLPNEDAQQILEDTLTVVARKAASYETATKADPTYGGEHFGETQRLAKKVIDRVRPEGHARRDSFLSFLGREGAGNHLEVVSFLADLGKLMSEDAPAHGRSGGGGGKGGADKLYDHETSRKADEQTAGR